MTDLKPSEETMPDRTGRGFDPEEHGNGHERTIHESVELAYQRANSAANHALAAHAEIGKVATEVASLRKSLPDLIGAAVQKKFAPLQQKVEQALRIAHTSSHDLEDIASVVDEHEDTKVRQREELARQKADLVRLETQLASAAAQLAAAARQKEIDDAIKAAKAFEDEKQRAKLERNVKLAYSLLTLVILVVGTTWAVFTFAVKHVDVPSKVAPATSIQYNGEKGSQKEGNAT